MIYTVLLRLFCPFYFADDTGLLDLQDSMYVINKTLNKDLSLLAFFSAIKLAIETMRQT